MALGKKDGLGFGRNELCKEFSVGESLKDRKKWSNNIKMDLNLCHYIKDPM